MREQRWMKKIGCKQQCQCRAAGCCQNRDDGSGTMRGKIEHEGQENRNYDCQAEVSSYCEREGNSQQQNAAPVPKHDLSRSVQCMRYRNAGEHCPKRSPGWADLWRRKP